MYAKDGCGRKQFSPKFDVFPILTAKQINNPEIVARTWKACNHSTFFNHPTELLSLAGVQDINREFVTSSGTLTLGSMILNLRARDDKTLFQALLLDGSTILAIYDTQEYLEAQHV